MVEYVIEMVCFLVVSSMSMKIPIVKRTIEKKAIDSQKQTSLNQLFDLLWGWFQKIATNNSRQYQHF